MNKIGDKYSITAQNLNDKVWCVYDYNLSLVKFIFRSNNMNKDSLGDRMKTYENVTRTYLTRRTPVVIRIDGKAFHSFTKGFKKPFDDVLVETMQQTMKYLCENIEGCVLGYTQSDEITLILCDYKKLTSQAWFNNNIQKICSISASMATLAFNRFFNENAKAYANRVLYYGTIYPCDEREKIYIDTLKKSISKGALFDSRVFNIPQDEVNNCLVWRQQDAIRNSIQSVAQANFSHTELMGINCKTLVEKMQEKGLNWNFLNTHLQRGSCCIKEGVFYLTTKGNTTVYRQKWVIDTHIPIFSDDPDYVNQRIIFKE